MWFKQNVHVHDSHEMHVCRHGSKMTTQPEKEFYELKLQKIHDDCSIRFLKEVR